MEAQSNTEQAREERPLVSIILATFNEAKGIERCLGSLLRQKTHDPSIGPFDLEVIAVDGMSADGTRQILEAFAAHEPRLHVVDNPQRRAPFAFNLGLGQARGSYVCIFGAHTIYREDYVAVCLSELMAHNAAACGGRVRTVPADNSLGARLSAWAMSHAFGSSRQSFRTQREGPVDTVNYAVFCRRLVLAAGGYDERLLRNQDNDLNQKLRANGHLLWCTWKTECFYFPKSTVRGLFGYAYGNGYWNATSLGKNPASMGLRHFVPFIFLMCLILAALAGSAGALALPHARWLPLLPLAALVGLHLSCGTAAAAQVSVKERSLGALALPFVFLGFHIAYGFGTLRGFLSQPWTPWLPKMRPRRNSIPLGD